MAIRCVFGGLARLAVAFPILLGCAGNPVSEYQISHEQALSAVQASAVNGDDLSVHTRQVLRILDLEQVLDDDPLAACHAIAECEGGVPAWLKSVARAEIYYAHAEEVTDPERRAQLFLQAVVTAIRTLDDVADVASAFDPRQRLLTEIFNRGLARVLVLEQRRQGHPSEWKTLARTIHEHSRRARPAAAVASSDGSLRSPPTSGLPTVCSAGLHPASADFGRLPRHNGR